MISTVYRTKPFDAEAARNGALCAVVPVEESATSSYTPHTDSFTFSPFTSEEMPESTPEEPIGEQEISDYDYYDSVGTMDPVDGEDTPTDVVPVNNSENGPIQQGVIRPITSRDFVIDVNESETQSPVDQQVDPTRTRNFVGVNRSTFKDDYFYITVNGIEYKFDSEGKAANVQSRAYCLKLAEVQSVAGDSSIVWQDETEAITYITSLELIDEIALKVLPSLLERIIDNPVDVGDSGLLYCCQKAYKWAEGMLYVATKRRTPVEDDEEENEEEGSGE